MTGRFVGFTPFERCMDHLKWSKKMPVYQPHMIAGNHPYCWWLKSCTTKDDDYPIICRVLTIPGGCLVFLPSPRITGHRTCPWPVCPRCHGSRSTTFLSSLRKRRIHPSTPSVRPMSCNSVEHHGGTWWSDGGQRTPGSLVQQRWEVFCTKNVRKFWFLGSISNYQAQWNVLRKNHLCCGGWWALRGFRV